MPINYRPYRGFHVSNNGGLEEVILYGKLRHRLTMGEQANSPMNPNKELLKPREKTETVMHEIKPRLSMDESTPFDNMVDKGDLLWTKLRITVQDGITELKTTDYRYYV